MLNSVKKIWPRPKINEFYSSKLLTRPLIEGFLFIRKPWTWTSSSNKNQDFANIGLNYACYNLAILIFEQIIVHNNGWSFKKQNKLGNLIINVMELFVNSFN
jgi:hypothetical protein